MKKLILIIILVILVASAYFLVSEPEAVSQNTPSSNHQPEYGGTLVVGIPRDVDTFNPLFTETLFGWEIVHLMLLGLADLNDRSEFEPELATSWEHSGDLLKLTYHLRKDAVWADGVPVTAEDVKFTFDLLMDTSIASPHRDKLEFVKSVSIVDSHTVTIEFTEAYPYQVFDTAGEVLPKHILEKVDRKALRSDPFGRTPLSSGPFVMKEWKNQQYIELVANEHYFGGRPYLDRVIFKIIPDNTNLMTQLQTGEVDMVINVPPQEVKRLKEASSNIRFYSTSGRVYHYIGYNTKNPRFSSPTTRQALTMAIDRQGIIDALLYGYGKACTGHIAPLLSWAYNETVKPISYDPKAASQSLAKEGWTDSDGDGWLDKNGKPFEFNIKADAANRTKMDVAVIVQEQLKKIGIKVNIKSLEWTTFVESLSDDDLEAWVGGWSTSLYVDPTPVFHSTANKDLFNYGHYANPEVDRLIEAGREEVDRKKAAAIWHELQEIVYREQPYTFLYWIDRIIAVNNRFQNVTPIPLSALYNLERWYQTPAPTAMKGNDSN